MSNKLIDIICSLVFLLTGAFLYWQSLSIAPMIERDLGSGFMPKIVAVALMAVAGLKLIVSLLSKDTRVIKTDADMRGGLMTIGALLFYVVAFEFVGFIIATAIYVFIQTLILSDDTNRKPKLFALIAISTSLVVYGLFVYVFEKPMPTGLLGMLGM